ncbi:hypothetical protein [Klebsiella sp. PL-2018]|uniref:hypothetical protein n=1 Tax=Klebsiella sp. PL-2018 TaxID=2851540 RepID=UPI001C2397D5|nr:hypothetical protein [Klebsiella sp. PL-2018]QXC99354.1 hypothetical protein MKleb_3854 [Klebsiella sp. PL-2018]
MAHMTVKELVAAAHSVAPSLPPAKAKLMREMASRLDVTHVALAEALSQNTEMATQIENLSGANTHG